MDDDSEMEMAMGALAPVNIARTVTSGQDLACVALLQSTTERGRASRD